jgi:acetyl esterase/lipase
VSRVVRRRRGVRIAGLAAVALVALACTRSEGASLSPTSSSTTTSTTATTAPTSTTSTTSSTRPEVTIPGREDSPQPPGTVLWSDQLDAGDLPGEVWAVTYRSAGTEDRRIAVSGIVAVPEGDPPPGGFPVLAWAHGTTGIDDQCAPSDRGVRAVPRLREHLEAGYVVAATDYEGLGTPGIHPYLVAESEARSVLDSVRAARELIGTDVVSARLVLLGHSQGGHAVLAAAERVRTWAPELQLVGTAALAPVADLELVIPALFDSTIGLALGIYVAAGWSAAHPELSPSDLLSPEGVALLDDAARTCIADMGDVIGDRELEALRVQRPTEVEAWARRIRDNSIDTTAVVGPVLVAQGDRDGIVPRPLIDRMVGELCDAGVPLRYISHCGAEHNTIVGIAMPGVHDWFAHLLEGNPPRTDCARRG